MISDLEKEIIKLMKRHGLEKESMIPTMLILRNLENYQKQFLEFLKTHNSLTEYDIIVEIKQMGCLENNPNVIEVDN